MSWQPEVDELALRKRLAQQMAGRRKCSGIKRPAN
ncbi:Uncharacterised protein [Bordetella trematum]|nr:Uncharacterised protein [Bordetella trematum]